jgi:hypothetical protein
MVHIWIDRVRQSAASTIDRSIGSWRTAMKHVRRRRHLAGRCLVQAIEKLGDEMMMDKAKSCAGAWVRSKREGGVASEAIEKGSMRDWRKRKAARKRTEPEVALPQSTTHPQSTSATAREDAHVPIVQSSNSFLVTVFCSHVGSHASCLRLSDVHTRQRPSTHIQHVPDNTNFAHYCTRCINSDVTDFTFMPLATTRA